MASCDLAKADFTDADLRFAVLIGANLKSASLKHANLICADLREAQLIGTNFWGASLRKSKIEGPSRISILPYMLLGKIFFPIQSLEEKTARKD